MNEVDSVAQRYPQNDGRNLIDYVPIYLPCQILYLDALLIDRHPLPSPVEFILKAIQAGITIPEDIGNFLGFTDSYSIKLIEQMKNEEYIAGDINGNLKVLKRGSEALIQHGERTLKDKTIPVLWDTITESPIQGRPELFSDRDKSIDSVKIKFPAILKTPDISEINVSAIQSYRRAIRDVDEFFNNEDILRFVNTRKVLFRWREAIALIYENEKALPIVKLAINGQINELLSSQFAQKNGVKHLNINNQFLRKAGAIAVEDRYKKLFSNSNSTSIISLSQRRGVLKWRLKTMLERLEENASSDLTEQYRNLDAELKTIESNLLEIPVRPMSCIEMQLSLQDALDNVKNNLIITTTLPNIERFSANIIARLKATLARNVKILIYISDRLESSLSNPRLKTPASRLNDLQSQYSDRLQVNFLKQSPRPVYEICWDHMELAFSNDSVLGSRPDHGVPRGFKGYRISGDIVSQYVEKHLTFTEADIVRQIRTRQFKKNKQSIKPSHRR